MTIFALTLIIATITISILIFLKKRKNYNQERSLLNTKETPFALIDRNGKIYAFNSFFSSLFNISIDEEIKSNSFEEIIKKNQTVFSIISHLIKKKQIKEVFEYDFTDGHNNKFTSKISITKSYTKNNKNYYYLELVPVVKSTNKVDDYDFHKINNLLTIVMGAVQILNIYSDPKKQNEESSIKIKKQVKDARLAIKEINHILKDTKESLLEEAA